MEITECALDLEAFPANGIAMGGCQMRIAIMAAGSVGGYFGGRMAAAGHSVAFIARGAPLALRDLGRARVILTLSWPGLSLPDPFKGHLFGRWPYTHQIASSRFGKSGVAAGYGRELYVMA
jgi:hypothetical protein